MGNFTPRISFTIEFDGDKIEFHCARLKRTHMRALAPFIPEPGPDGQVTGDVAENLDLLSAFLDVLPELKPAMNGMKSDDGVDTALTDILNEFYYTDFFAAVLGRVIDASQLQEKQAKKSKKPRRGA